LQRRWGELDHCVPVTGPGLESWGKSGPGVHPAGSRIDVYGPAAGLNVTTYSRDRRWRAGGPARDPAATPRAAQTGRESWPGPSNWGTPSVFRRPSRAVTTSNSASRRPRVMTASSDARMRRGGPPAAGRACGDAGLAIYNTNYSVGLARTAFLRRVREREARLAAWRVCGAGLHAHSSIR